MSQAPGPSADELELAAAAASINRAKSAPPAAVNAAPSLFSPNTGYAALFGDMRLSEHYELFAQTMRDPRLPPPLQYSVYRDVSAQREISSLGAASPHLAVQAVRVCRFTVSCVDALVSCRIRLLSPSISKEFGTQLLALRHLRFSSQPSFPWPSLLLLGVNPV